MIRDAYLVKKELQGSVNRAVNVADLMRRNKFERKQEKKTQPNFCNCSFINVSNKSIYNFALASLNYYKSILIKKKFKQNFYYIEFLYVYFR